MAAFDFKAWAKNGIIEAYNQGQYGDIDVIVLTAGYVSKGLLTESDAAVIAAATTEKPKTDATDTTDTSTTTTATTATTDTTAITDATATAG